MTDQRDGLGRRRIDMMGASAKEKIELLIEQAESPKDKAYLLITLQLVDAIQDNTELTKKIAEDLERQSDKFETHERADLTLISTGKGIYRTSIFFLGFLQAITVGGLALLAKDYLALRETVYQTHEARMSQLALDMQLHAERQKFEDALKNGGLK